MKGKGPYFLNYHCSTFKKELFRGVACGVGGLISEVGRGEWSKYIKKNACMCRWRPRPAYLNQGPTSSSPSHPGSWVRTPAPTNTQPPSPSRPRPSLYTSCRRRTPCRHRPHHHAPVARLVQLREYGTLKKDSTVRFLVWVSWETSIAQSMRKVHYNAPFAV